MLQDIVYAKSKFKLPEIEYKKKDDIKKKNL